VRRKTVNSTEGSLDRSTALRLASNSTTPQIHPRGLKSSFVSSDKLASVLVIARLSDGPLYLLSRDSGYWFELQISPDIADFVSPQHRRCSPHPRSCGNVTILLATSALPPVTSGTGESWRALHILCRLRVYPWKVTIFDIYRRMALVDQVVCRVVARGYNPDTPWWPTRVQVKSLRQAGLLELKNKKTKIWRSPALRSHLTLI
jgi:hypothetical protein